MPLSGDYEPSTMEWVRTQVERYETSGGTRATTIVGKPVVIVTSVGAKTGRLRKNPVMRVEHEGAYAAVASLGGAPRHPVWYWNLLAHPLVELQDGPVKGDFVARLVEGEQKARWWERAVQAYPEYEAYQAKTDREIPVFVLDGAPADGTGSDRSGRG